MSPRTRAVYIVDAVRTPIGRYNGALAAVRPDDLAAHTLRALLERTPELDPARIGDVVLGNANGAGYVLPKSERPFPAGHTELYSTTLGWRMVNPRMDPQWTVPLGESAELIAEKHAISRERQDAFALASHLKAAAARDAGLFDGEIAPVTVPARRGEPTVVDRDESIRANTSPEALAALKPAFRTEGGTVTAGNSSPLNDGAAALLLADEDGLRATGREPLARITAHAVSACEPHYFGLAPVQAVHRALDRAGRAFADLATLELNEAFAAQVLGCLAERPELDPAVLNPRGGAIALGHPLGASGARLAGAVAHQLAARGSGTGVAALCIGVGQGSALVLER